MARIRVILALAPSIFRESLRTALESAADIYVVGEVDQHIHLLLEVEGYEADAVVLQAQNDNNVPGICSHLFHEYPHLLVVALSRSDGGAVIYRQEVIEQRTHTLSIGDLLTVLRTANTTYWNSP